MKFLAALIPALGNLTRGIIAQLLVALGITLVTYKGIENLLANFKNQITSNQADQPDRQKIGV